MVAAIKFVESGARRARARGLLLAVPPYAVGIAGLLQDSWPGAPHLAGVNLHAIFGALLWVMVVAQFNRANLAASSLNGVGVHEFCRRLSRRVYLLLYVLFGVSALVRMAALLWNSAEQGASYPALLPPPENLRDYLAYGVVALLTIRVLAAAHHQALKHIVAS